MPSSFINEHTAEFLIVPAFGAILSTKFERVIPVHFWSSREGGMVSLQSLTNQHIYVVALFARRPKVERPFQPLVEVKFNDRLFRAASFLEDHDIPVFAGVPLSSSLDDFHLATPCMWYRLPGNGQEEVIRIDVAAPVTPTPRFVLTCNADTILHTIMNFCRPMSWKSAVTTFRELKSRIIPRYGWHFLFGDIYKPVYFILPQAGGARP